jgi:hypothetical protein
MTTAMNAGVLGEAAVRRSALAWWLRVVGSFYVLQFVANALLQAPIRCVVAPDGGGNVPLLGRRCVLGCARRACAWAIRRSREAMHSSRVEPGC